MNIKGWPERKEHAFDCSINHYSFCACGADPANAMRDECAKAVEGINYEDLWRDFEQFLEPHTCDLIIQPHYARNANLIQSWFKRKFVPKVPNASISDGAGKVEATPGGKFAMTYEDFVQLIVKWENGDLNLVELYDKFTPGHTNSILDSLIADLECVGHHMVSEEIWRVKELKGKLTLGPRTDGDQSEYEKGFKHGQLMAEKSIDGDRVSVKTLTTFFHRNLHPHISLPVCRTLAEDTIELLTKGEAGT